jgi:hypothetical protein
VAGRPPLVLRLAAVAVRWARAAATPDLGGCGDAWQREPADGDALHPRRRQREQVRGLELTVAADTRHRIDGNTGPSAVGKRRR